MYSRSKLRPIAETLAPSMAAKYRRKRDESRQYTTGPTPWGFELSGDRGLADSRAASREAEVFIGAARHVDHVIDIGANVGLFTLISACHLGVPVTAIEPNPTNLAQLYQNLQRNRAESVGVIPVAVSDGIGLGDLYGGGQGASLLRGWGGIGSNYVNTVPLWTLDELFADRLAGRRLLIKVDVEGAELAVLRGATLILSQDPAPTWIVEIGLTENFSGSINPDFIGIFETFWSLGYSSWALEADVTVTPEDVMQWVAAGDRGFWNINYVFTKAQGRRED